MEKPVSTTQKCSSILIVEDEKDIRVALKQALEFEGYQVFSAANGQEALKMLPTVATPCLILLDLMMPVMNGWQFVDAIGGDSYLATIPVVIVSAFGDKAKTIKAQGFVKKPVDLDALYKFVKMYCG